MIKSQLVRKIRQLKKVKPKKDWVLLTKTQILGQETTFNLLPFLRPAYAGLFALLLLAGLFEFSQGALPGESLYYLKKIVEKGQIILSSEEERPRMNLELANKRLEELNQIVQKNEVRKLAPAMDEFRANVSAAAKNLTNVKKISKEIVAQIQKLEENEEELGKILATKVGNEEYEEYNIALAQLVERQILELEEKTLSKDDEVILKAARQDFESGDYSEALIKILVLSQY